MRSIRRLLTATAVGVAMTAGTIAVAGPAVASPEDGKGCVGTPTLPAAYVCLISANPANALPTVTSTPVQVPVPEICYFLDCTDPTSVPVPVPSAGLNNGDIAVVWYRGVYYPIGIAVAGQVVAIANSAIQLAVTTVNGAVATVNGTVNGTVATVNGIVRGLPSSTEVLQTVSRTIGPWVTYLNDTVASVRNDVDSTVDSLPTTTEILQAVVSAIRPYVDYVNEIRDGLPGSYQEILEIVRDSKYYDLALQLVRFVLDQIPDTTT